MGEAKRRGTFDQRKVKAREKLDAYYKDLAERRAASLKERTRRAIELTAEQHEARLSARLVSPRVLYTGGMGLSAATVARIAGALSATKPTP